MLKQLVIETAMQWGIFMVIPLLVYVIFFRAKINLTEFLGLIKPIKVESGLLIKLGIVFTVYFILGLFWARKYDLGLEDDTRLLSFKERGLSIQTILILLIQSVIRTAFLEEIIFRGFFINIFKNSFGFTIANNIQALIFTGIHTLGMRKMNFINIGLGTVLIYILSIYFGKVTLASGGSIFYSTLYHGIGNILTGIVLMLYESKQSSKINER